MQMTFRQYRFHGWRKVLTGLVAIVCSVLGIVYLLAAAVAPFDIEEQQPLFIVLRMAAIGVTLLVIGFGLLRWAVQSPTDAATKGIE